MKSTKNPLGGNIQTAHPVRYSYNMEWLQERLMFEGVSKQDQSEDEIHERTLQFHLLGRKFKCALSQSSFILKFYFFNFASVLTFRVD